MSDAYDERLDRAFQELAHSSIRKMNYAPPLFHAAKALGLRPRPPHYMGFKRAILATGPAFGLSWGVLMWFLMWRSTGMTLAVALVAALLAGALFGLMMAAYYRWSASEAGLSRWEDL